MLVSVGELMLTCAAVMAAGCGRLGFDASDAIDAPLGPFGQPHLIPQFSSALPEAEPSVTGDGLELVFRRRLPPANDDLFLSTRSTIADAWGDPVPMTELNTANAEGAPGIASDGLTLWFSSNRPGGIGAIDIYVTTRRDRASSWSMPLPVVEVDTTANDTKPCVSSDGLVMFLDNAAPLHQIKRSKRESPTSPWSFPELVSELDLAELEGGAQPFSSLELVFSATLGGQWDIFHARRASPPEPYTVLEPMIELNTAFTEFDPWVSLDGHMVVFGSTRSGNEELYEATR